MDNQIISNQTRYFDVQCGDGRNEHVFLYWNWRQGVGKLPVLVFFMVRLLMVSAEYNLPLLHDLSPLGKAPNLDITCRLFPHWRNWFVPVRHGSVLQFAMIRLFFLVHEYVAILACLRIAYSPLFLKQINGCHLEKNGHYWSSAEAHLHVGLHWIHRPGVLSLAWLPLPREGARDGPSGAGWWIAGAPIEQPIHHHQTYMSTYERPCKSSYQKNMNKQI